MFLIVTLAVVGIAVAAAAWYDRRHGTRQITAPHQSREVSPRMDVPEAAGGGS